MRISVQMTHHNDSYDELEPVIERLRAGRPELTALELDAAKRRIVSRTARGRRARSANLMKSRIGILATLVVGMLLSTAGAGLAIDGIASSWNNAGVAQYGEKPGDTNPGGGDVLGEEDSGGGDQGTSPGTTSPDQGSGPELQPSRQVESGAQGNGELPFTGFLAIPVLLGGIALLTTGLVLRRASPREADRH